VEGQEFSEKHMIKDTVIWARQSFL